MNPVHWTLPIRYVAPTAELHALETDVGGRSLRFGPWELFRKCVFCGCTDEDCRGCIERTGRPCFWIADTVCSACEPELVRWRRRRAAARAAEARG